MCHAQNQYDGTCIDYIYDAELRLTQKTHFFTWYPYEGLLSSIKLVTHYN